MTAPTNSNALPPKPPYRFDATKLGNIQQALKKLCRWVLWDYELRHGEWTKPPFRISGGHADSTDIKTCSIFEDAAEKFDTAFITGVTPERRGIGFVFTDTLYSGIDFDGTLVDGKLESYAANILELLGNPCADISPSGTGVKIIVEGKLPQGLSHKFSKGHYGAEVYSTDRYFTLTGDRYGSGDGIPKLEADQFTFIHFLLSQILDKEFKHLWCGGLPHHGKDLSASGGDFQLMSMIRKNLPTNDPAVLKKYFTASKRMQDKGSRKDELIDRVVAAALKGSVSPAASLDISDLEFHLPPIEVTEQEDDDFVIEPLPSKLKQDGWFPLGSPSLVGGLSGSNKSTWMTQLLIAQFYKQLFFGHTTKGRPFLIIMADRGAASHRRTMRRMGLSPEAVPIKFISAKTGLVALQEIVNQIEVTSPLPQVAFVEGLDMLVDDANKKSTVVPFMEGLRKIAERYHIAVTGSVGSLKPRNLSAITIFNSLSML